MQSNEAEAHELLDYYVEERGGNFIDAAEMYPAPASDPVYPCGLRGRRFTLWLSVPSWHTRDAGSPDNLDVRSDGCPA